MSRSPARAASPGRKSVTGGRMDAIVGLSEDELKSFAGSGSLPIDEAELNAAFDFFDVEGRGKLTVADLKRLSEGPQSDIEKDETLEVIHQALGRDGLGIIAVRGVEGLQVRMPSIYLSIIVSQGSRLKAQASIQFRCVSFFLSFSSY